MLQVLDNDENESNPVAATTPGAPDSTDLDLLVFDLLSQDTEIRFGLPNVDGIVSAVGFESSHRKMDRSIGNGIEERPVVGNDHE